MAEGTLPGQANQSSYDAFAAALRGQAPGPSTPAPKPSPQRVLDVPPASVGANQSIGGWLKGFLPGFAAGVSTVGQLPPIRDAANADAMNSVMSGQIGGPVGAAVVAAAQPRLANQMAAVNGSTPPYPAPPAAPAAAYTLGGDGYAPGAPVSAAGVPAGPGWGLRDTIAKITSPFAAAPQNAGEQLGNTVQPPAPPPAQSKAQAGGISTYHTGETHPATHTLAEFVNANRHLTNQDVMAMQAFLTPQMTPAMHAGIMAQNLAQQIAERIGQGAKQDDPGLAALYRMQAAYGAVMAASNPMNAGLYGAMYGGAQ